MHIRLKGRLAGVFYIAVIIAGLFSEMAVRSQIVVGDDPSATLANIIANESRFRFGGAVGIAMLAFDLAIAALLFEILRPAGEGLSRAAAYFRVAFAGMMGVVSFLNFIPLTLIAGGDTLSSFSSQAIEQVSYLSLRIHSLGFTIALAFFGVHCALVGALILKSGIIPRLIGLLMVIAGGAYLINTFADLIAPAFGKGLFPFILLPPLVAETMLALWLTAFGAKEPGNLA